MVMVNFQTPKEDYHSHINTARLSSLIQNHRVCSSTFRYLSDRYRGIETIPAFSQVFETLEAAKSLDRLSNPPASIR